MLSPCYRATTFHQVEGALALYCCVAADELEGVSNKEIMELLLLTQYFDMVRDVGQASKGSTLFMTHSPSAVNKVRPGTSLICRTYTHCVCCATCTLKKAHPCIHWCGEWMHNCTLCGAMAAYTEMHACTVASNAYMQVI